MNSLSLARLEEVHPILRGRIIKLDQILQQEGIDLIVTQGLRTWTEQAKLYAQGRTAPGPIVTHAPPGHSWHQVALAVDVAPLDREGLIDWNPAHPVWKRIERVAESLGLVSGAQFRTFPDAPHLQLTGKLPASPDDEARRLFAEGGISAVWEATGLIVDV